MRDIGQGCCLVRYAAQEDVDALVRSTNGALWGGAQLSAARYAMSPIQGARWVGQARHQAASEVSAGASRQL
jgi:hypothetical protein